MAKEFQAITSQEQLDNVIGERLRRQKEQFEEKIKEYEALKEENSKLQTELEQKNQFIEENKKETSMKTEDYENLEKELNTLKLQQLKQKIAINNGIPLDLANRLSGDNEETLLEDAKTLSQFINSNPTPQPLKSVEDKNVNDEDMAYRQLLNQIQGE